MTAIPTLQTEVPSGVTTEAAAPIETQPVQPAAQVTEGAQPEVAGLGTPETQEAIPYERFQQMNESNKTKVDTLTQQLQLAQQQNSLYQANMQHVQQQPQTQSRLDQIAEKLNGLDDDDGAINVSEAKDIVAAIKEQQTNMNISQQQQLQTTFLANNPDYSTMVGQNVPGLGFQYAPEFIAILNNNPASYHQISSMTNEVQQAEAMLNLANQHKVVAPVVPAVPVFGAPPSLSALPTPGGLSSTAANYAPMDNAEFLKMVDQMPKTP